MNDQAIQIYFEERGQGNPLVFIHGFPFDHSTWNPVVALLEKKARCLMPDLRGFGKSKVTGNRSTIPMMADDIMRLLDDLKIDRACFIGHSMGGYVAMQIAHAYRERVFGLGLVTTRSDPDSVEKAAERLASRGAVLAGGTSTLIAGMLERLTNKPETRSQIRPIMEKATPQGIAMALFAMAHRKDATGWLQELEFPIVIMAGGNDIITPEREMKDLCGKLKDGRFYSSSTASHMLPMEEPGLIARALEETYLNN